eukprot:GHVU01173688.1.p1 GENE.GHVU01173688.1~~GHVU01173688.1.p1  ORF type:complete len:126 (-),score=7.94 GHVU01173688.1:146-523(-)
MRDVGCEILEEVPGDFNVLRKVIVDGDGASRWFATDAMGWTSLEELHIWDGDRFVHQLPGSYVKLRALNMGGDGVECCYVTVPETCVSVCKLVSFAARRSTHGWRLSLCGPIYRTLRPGVCRAGL